MDLKTWKEVQGTGSKTGRPRFLISKLCENSLFFFFRQTMAQFVSEIHSMTMEHGF